MVIECLTVLISGSQSCQVFHRCEADLWRPRWWLSAWRYWFQVLKVVRLFIGVKLIYEGLDDDWVLDGFAHRWSDAWEWWHWRWRRSSSSEETFWMSWCLPQTCPSVCVVSFQPAWPGWGCGPCSARRMARSTSPSSSVCESTRYVKSVLFVDFSVCKVMRSVLMLTLVFEWKR